MSVWVMADLHLSLGGEKPMDRFGSRWEDHAEKINARWRSVVREGDTVVSPGDISWADTLAEAEPDLAFVHALPGKKLLGKGNHDYWWASVSKMKRFLEERGFSSIDFLYNNAAEAEGLVLAGGRGWFLDERQQIAFEADYEKLVRREYGRLALSLDAAEALRKERGIAEPPAVFLHFPPVYGEFRLDPLVELMLAHGVRRCWYGHIHGQYAQPPYADWRGIRFTNAAADYLNFTPLPVKL